MSIDSQIALLVATLARPIWFADTKLPSMWSACIELCVALCLHLVIVYFCVKHKDALQQEIPFYLRWFAIVTYAAGLSCCFYPGKAGKYFVTQQMFVSFTMFTEALSLLPQLFHMRMSKGVEGLNSQYLIALGAARFSRIFFWYTMSQKALSNFWYLISADAIYALLVISFAVMFRSTAKTTTEGVLGFTGRRLTRDD